jgi:hypothetical protein
VTLLRLGCRSRACGLRRVPALLVFYSSFSSQNTLQCRSQCIKNATDCVEIKRVKMFSVTLYMLRQTLCRLALFIFPSPLSVTQLKLRVILRPLYLHFPISAGFSNFLTGRFSLPRRMQAKYFKIGHKRLVPKPYVIIFISIFQAHPTLYKLSS